MQLRLVNSWLTRADVWHIEPIRYGIQSALSMRSKGNYMLWVCYCIVTTMEGGGLLGWLVSVSLAHLCCLLQGCG